ncbi:hypothetical protein [Streptosporangium sp. KLBMP 9127]|nr:hypothetical protein [Streptosporangium sp. KLBMP 9127]
MAGSGPGSGDGRAREGFVEASDRAKIGVRLAVMANVEDELLGAQGLTGGDGMQGGRAVAAAALAAGTPLPSDPELLLTAPPAADIDVDLGAQPNLGILVPYLRYTLTADNAGPNAVTSATLPPGASATNLSSGCTTGAGTVTCTLRGHRQRRLGGQDVPRAAVATVAGPGHRHRDPHHQCPSRPQPGQRQRLVHRHLHSSGHLPVTAPALRSAG